MDHRLEAGATQESQLEAGATQESQLEAGASRTSQLEAGAAPTSWRECYSPANFAAGVGCHTRIAVVAGGVSALYDVVAWARNVGLRLVFLRQM